MNQNLSLARTR